MEKVIRSYVIDGINYNEKKYDICYLQKLIDFLFQKYLQSDLKFDINYTYFPPNYMNREPNFFNKIKQIPYKFYGARNDFHCGICSNIPVCCVINFILFRSFNAHIKKSEPWYNDKLYQFQYWYNQLKFIRYGLFKTPGYVPCFIHLLLKDQRVINECHDGCYCSKLLKNMEV